MNEKVKQYLELVEQMKTIEKRIDAIKGEWDECSKVQVSFHNDGKTLKVFLTGNIK